MIPAIIWKYFEKRYVFFPTSDVEFTPDDVGVAYQEVFFPTETGLKLHGWYIPGPGDFTWLWFHGNGGNIGHRVTELALLHQRLGISILIFDYRGFGRSEGLPSEQGTYQDARAALAYLRQQHGLAPDAIVYFGHSLGTAVALELAASESPAGLVLVSPFASISEMSRLVFPRLPSAWLVRNKYNSLARVAKVQCPVLILHGELDETVPIAQGRKLFDHANPPKRFQALPWAAHNDTFEQGGEDYWEAFQEFLELLGKSRRIPDH
jgi:fermentation-respiration switch protein FrsA (DUF1100 family)